MKRGALLIFVCALLSACASEPQISDADACISYGAQPGTTEYFQCRMAKDQQRQANTAAIAGILLSRPQPQPYVLPIPQRY